MEATIKFEHYFIDKIILDMPSLAATGCFDDASEFTEKMAMTFGVNIEIDDDHNLGKVALEVAVRPSELPPLCQGEIPSFITARIVGVFSQGTKEKMDHDQFKKMCEINGVASLFPFLRAAVADIARISNVSTPIILPLINVPEMMKTMKQSEN